MIHNQRFSPSAEEICDGIDNDCDPATDESSCPADENEGPAAP